MTQFVATADNLFTHTNDVRKKGVFGDQRFSDIQNKHLISGRHWSNLITLQGADSRPDADSTAALVMGRHSVAESGRTSNRLEVLTRAGAGATMCDCRTSICAHRTMSCQGIMARVSTNLNVAAFRFSSNGAA